MDYVYKEAIITYSMRRGCCDAFYSIHRHFDQLSKRSCNTFYLKLNLHAILFANSCKTCKVKVIHAELEGNEEMERVSLKNRS